MQAEPMRVVEPQIKTVESDKGKEKMSTAASAVYQQPLLNDETFKRLDKSAKLLYNILTTIDGSIALTDWKIFGYKEDEFSAWLLKEEIIDVLKAMKSPSLCCKFSAWLVKTD